MMVAIAIQLVCFPNKTLVLNSFSVYFSRFSVRTIVLCDISNNLSTAFFNHQTQMIMKSDRWVTEISVRGWLRTLLSFERININ